MNERVTYTQKDQYLKNSIDLLKHDINEKLRIVQIS